MGCGINYLETSPKRLRAYFDIELVQALGSIVLSTVFLCLFLISSVQLASSNSHEMNMLERENAYTLSKKHKTKLIAIQLGILNLKENTEWLTLKIKKINNMNLLVTERIYNFLNYKVLKAEVLEKEKANYASLLKRLKIKETDKKVQ